MTEYRLTIGDAPSPEDVRIVDEGLNSYNIARAGDAHFRRLSIFIRDDAGNVMGGLLGMTYWEWLRVDVLWVDEKLRGKGYGSKLMAAAEAEALTRKCKYSFLDTHSFQARPFYERLGYEVFGVLEHYPAEHKRFFMQKKLSPTPDESDSSNAHGKETRS